MGEDLLARTLVSGIAGELAMFSIREKTKTVKANSVLKLDFVASYKLNCAVL